MSIIYSEKVQGNEIHYLETKTLQSVWDFFFRIIETFIIKLWISQHNKIHQFYDGFVICSEVRTEEKNEVMGPGLLLSGLWLSRECLEGPAQCLVRHCREQKRNRHPGSRSHLSCVYDTGDTSVVEKHGLFHI